MEKIDKDIEAMIKNLKAYDKLTESVAPVLMSRVAESEAVDAGVEDEEVDMDRDDLEEKVDKSAIPAALRKKSGDANWKMSTADLEAEKNKSPTTKAGLEKKMADTGVKEGVDPDVLEWMQRFSKLGNMKGYGR